MNQEVYVRFYEGVGVKFPRATRPLIHTSLEFTRHRMLRIKKRSKGLRIFLV